MVLTAYEANGGGQADTISAPLPNYPVIESPSITKPPAARNGRGLFSCNSPVIPARPERGAVTYGSVKSFSGTRSCADIFGPFVRRSEAGCNPWQLMS